MSSVSLTPRERDCLHWVSKGKTSWEIGQILGIGERTANFHIANFCGKLDVSTRQAAITVAMQKGLLQPSVADPSVLNVPTRKAPKPASARKARSRQPAPAHSLRGRQ